MLSFFKKKKNRTLKKGASFYHRENLIQTVDELIKLLNLLNSSNNIKTSSNLLFREYELNSISEKGLKKDFGEESYILQPDSGITGHKIYYYRFKSESIRFLIQLHFIDNQFICAINKVYSDIMLSASNKQKVIEQIVNKYYPEAINGIFDFCLEDPKGNILCTNDSVFYYLKYIVNNPFSQKLKKQYEGYEKSKSGQEMDTLKKLI